MKYLSSKSLVHRNLAARNILESAEISCKVCQQLYITFLCVYVVFVHACARYVVYVCVCVLYGVWMGE